MRAWFTPGHGAGALAGDRERDRARPAAGADRLAGDHLGADPRHAGGARRRAARRGRRRRHRRAADRRRLRAVGATTAPRPGRSRCWRRCSALLPFSGKRSTPWAPDSVHDFMHAKVTVADDTVFVGSFNLSRSGEMNAENVLEIRDAAARRPDGRRSSTRSAPATRRPRCPSRRSRRSPRGRRRARRSRGPPPRSCPPASSSERIQLEQAGPVVAAGEHDRVVDGLCRSGSGSAPRTARRACRSRRGGRRTACE